MADYGDVKVCPNCGITKNRSEFAKHYKRADGLQVNCTPCRHKLYQENRDVILSKRKKKYKANKKALLAKQRKYYDAHKVKRLAYGKQYREDNKAELSIKQLERQRNRRATDVGFRTLQNIRRRTNHVVKGHSRTTKYIGCTSNELRSHLESLFLNGMSWSNYGNCSGCWNVDHKLPLDSYERDDNGNWIEDSNYNQSLIHYTNLQPLWRRDNILKSNKTT